MNQDLITFIAFGQPKGQPRPRAVAFGKSARVYDPSTAEGWKAQIALGAKEHLPPEPLDLALCVGLEFLMPRPKSHYRTGRNAHLLRDAAPAYPTGKPDIDNLVKAVLDILTQVGMWNDDKQITVLEASKRYAPAGVRPGLKVDIEPDTSAVEVMKPPQTLPFSGATA